MGSTFAVILFLIMAASSWAATDCSVVTCKYVRAGANGNGSDWDNAYGSLPTTLQRGATYFIADGSYPSYTFDDAQSGSLYITIKKAIASDHGTDQGWDDTLGDGQASFNSTLTFTRGYYIIDGQVRNENDWFDGASYGIRVAHNNQDQNIVISQGSSSSNITIKHTFVDAIVGNLPSVTVRRYAIDTDNYDRGTVATNLVFSRMFVNGSNNVWFLRTTNGAIVEYSASNGVDGNGANHGEIVNLYYSGNNAIIRHNKFKNAYLNGGGTALVAITYANGVQYYGNVAWDFLVGDAAIGFDGGDASNCKIYNNTFIRARGASGFASNGTNNQVYNNIFIDNRSVRLSGAHNYNAFSGTNNFSEPNAQINVSTSIFRNYAANDFSLVAPTAPGLSLSSPYNQDITGAVRGSDGVADRGAYEFVSGSTLPEVLAAPSSLRLVSSSSSQLQIQFDYSGSSQSGFIIQRKTGSSGSYVEVATQTGTAYSDSGLQASTQYCYKVQAYNSSTESALSNELCASTSAAPTTPAPTPVSGENMLGMSTPEITSENDGTAYELGMKFKSLKAGKISAIRFYKSPSETGVHTGKIYSSTGTLLASATFMNESASGWQQVSLSSPLSIAANTVYVVAVNTGNNYYVSTVNGLAASKTSTNLQSVVGSNGVYGPTGSMPTNSWNNSNYFRDVVFNADELTPAPTPVPVSENLLGTLAPAAMNKNDGVNYELGMKIKVLKAGKISAIRFYKGSSETGTRTGKIYSSTGTLLASVTFSSLSASGWQVANLSSPLSVAAGAVVVVTVNTGAKYYVTTVSGLATAKSSASLETVGGGLFGAVGSMPTRIFQNSNYFRDIIFTPNP